MARRGIPNLDPRSAAELSGHLTDIVTKMESLRAYEDMGFFKQALPEMDRLNDAVNNQLKLAERLGKYWKSGGEDLKKVIKAHKEVKEALKHELSLTKQLEKHRDEADAKGDLEAVEEFKRALDENAEAIKKLRDWQRKLNEQYKTGQVLTKTARRQMIELTDAAFNASGKFGFGVAETAIEGFSRALKSGFDINERFRKTFAGMASQIGAFTPQLKDMQGTATQLYLTDLGAMGMSLEDVAGQVTGFATGLEYLDTSFGQNTASLTKWGVALGLSGEEVGQLSKNMLFMGQKADDAEKLMQQLARDAKILGVNSKQLAKEVLVLGKNLLAMAGPRFQSTMVNAIETFKKFGLSSQYLEKFTDMTDSFEASTTAMAKLNTMFGTHISSLQLLAEEDPAKRFEMITEQLRAQGIEFANLDRQTKRVAAGALNMSMEELNAFTQMTKGATDFTGALKKAQDQQEKNEKNNDLMAQGLQELKNTLVPIAQIMDRVLLKAMKALNPLFAAFGIETANVGSSLQGITAIATKVGQAFEQGFGRLLGDTAFQANLQKVGDKFKVIIDKFLDFLNSPKFGDFMLKVMDGFVGFLDSAGTAAKLVVDNLGSITSVLGFMVNHAKAFVAAWAAWKALNIAGDMAKIGYAMKDLGMLGGAGKGIAGGIPGAGPTQLGLPGMGGAGAAGAAAGGALKTGVGALAGSGLGGIATVLGGVTAAGAAGYGLGTLAQKTNFLWVNDIVQANLDAIFGNADQAYSRQKAKPRALGGPVAAGSPYIVGEHGPEPFIPSTNGTILPNSAMGPTVVQVILEGEVIQEKFIKNQLRSYT